MNKSRTRFSLLLVDDQAEVLLSLKKVFDGCNYHLFTAASGEDALTLLEGVKINAALIDLKMPGMGGFALLEEIQKKYPQIMTIILTGHGGVKEAVEAMKLGAVDFLEKPYSIEELHTRIAQLHQIWELKEENLKLKEQMDFTFGFDSLIGNSRSMLMLKQMIVRIAQTDTPILIQGETGTGKELVARAIHHHSTRRMNIFLPIDCASISPNVIESELFGHAKGAFTGAHQSTLGLIRAANGGTLFFDEIGEIPSHLQNKLLRTIQEQEVRPLGSSISHQVDVRILAATNRNLADEVSHGNFRQDLLYRLNAITVDIPPLRDRKDDIPLLVKYFLQRFGNTVSPVKDLSAEALNCLENHHWSGNIRELENVIRRAVALCKQDLILPEDLPASIFTPSDSAVAGMPFFPDDSLTSYEIAALRNALAKSKGNRRMAAQILGISEATLYRKITKYNMDM